jgi:hypothetical protein
MKIFRPTPVQLSALHQTHGAVHTVDIGEHQLVIKSPPRAEYKRWQKRLEKGDLADAAEDLGRSAVVFPSREEVEQLLDGGHPGALEVAGTEAARLAQGKDGSAKKYVPSSAAV